MTKITEELTLIEEALEDLIYSLSESTPDARHGGLDIAMRRDLERAGELFKGKFHSAVSRLGHKIATPHYQDQLNKHAAAYNKAHDDMQAHKEAGNMAGVEQAKMNMAHHRKRMGDYHSLIGAGGGTPKYSKSRVNKQTISKKATSNTNNASTQTKQSQSTSKTQSKTTQNKATNNTQANQSKSTPYYGTDWSKAFREARKSGDKSRLDALKAAYQKQQRKAAGTLKEAWDNAEVLVLALMESLENV